MSTKLTPAGFKYLTNGQNISGMRRLTGVWVTISWRPPSRHLPGHGSLVDHLDGLLLGEALH